MPSNVNDDVLATVSAPTERYATAGTTITTADTAIGPHHRGRAGQCAATRPAELARATSTTVR